MYAGLQKIKEVIDYIEKNITSDLDCNVLAAKMGLSVYEFRRIFSFIIGCPISEYIRKRRVSQPGALKYEEIPETLWACFKLNTVDDGQVNEIYSKLLCEWLPSAKLIKNNAVPVIEVYPFDMSADGFEWEIRIPVYV